MIPRRSHPYSLSVAASFRQCLGVCSGRTDNCEVKRWNGEIKRRGGGQRHEGRMYIIEACKKRMIRELSWQLPKETRTLLMISVISGMMFMQ